MKQTLFLTASISFWMLFLLASCKKDDNGEKLPILTTNQVTSITHNSAITGGRITDDGGAAITQRGVCWSIGQNPTINDNKTIDGTGTGSFTSEIKELEPKTSYYVRAYATNANGTGYGSDVAFTTTAPCPQTVTDVDGNLYNTVLIGSQCWMKENLNVGTMIPGLLTQYYYNGIIEKYCYNDDPINCATYGGLYLWNEMMQGNYQEGARGICPSGWHLPTDKEWKVLEGSVDSQTGITWDGVGWRGTDAGTNLKTTSGWSENGNGADLFGFSGLPGGSRSIVGFYFIGDSGHWWTSSRSVDFPWYRGLSYASPKVSRQHVDGMFYSSAGFSVRCLLD